MNGAQLNPGVPFEEKIFPYISLLYTEKEVPHIGKVSEFLTALLSIIHTEAV